MSPKELAKWKARGGAAPKVVTIHGLLPEGFRVLTAGAQQFRAVAEHSKAEDKCAGCAFRHQGFDVCDEVTRVAARARIPDCDDGVIYQLVAKDDSQIDLLNGENRD